MKIADFLKLDFQRPPSQDGPGGGACCSCLAGDNHSEAQSKGFFSGDSHAPNR